MSSSNVVLTYTRAGRNGRVQLTATRDGQPLHADCLNLIRATDRAAFFRKLMNLAPDLDAADMESQLLQVAAELASQPDQTPPDFGTLPELDVSMIVRPERFITADVSGLAVPTMTTAGDKPIGRWILYLRWADGRRECRPLPGVIDLPDKRRLWVHPTPAEPTPSTAAAWNAHARRTWLDGAAAPDPAEVFKALAERFAFYLDLPRDTGPAVVATLCLWVLLSYCYSPWHAIPYLYVGGPLGSGKSRLFEILSRLAFRPLPTSNLTGAALFRSLHSQGGTLLLDEAERLKQTQDPATAEILSMLLAGYKKGGQATRLEPVGESGFKTVSFDVYGPKALACVAGLPPALASRCIAITMFRAVPGSDKPRRRIDANRSGWQSLRDDLHVLALENGPTWLDLPNQCHVCPPMSGRDYELWQPLLALAWWIESYGAGGLLELLQAHALATIDAAKDDQTPDADETLLRILAEAIRYGERPEPGDLLKRAQEAEPSAFKSWTARGVTSHLKRYGVPTPTKTMGRRVFRDVTLDLLRRIQTSYGIDLSMPEQDEREKEHAQ